MENLKNAITYIIESPHLSLEALDQEKKQIEKEMESLNLAKFERLIASSISGSLW